jgi:hypothetical protein
MTRPPSRDSESPAHYCNFVDFPCATIVQLPALSADVSHLSAEDAQSFANASMQRLLLLHPIPVHVTVTPSILQDVEVIGSDERPACETRVGEIPGPGQRLGRPA